MITSWDPCHFSFSGQIGYVYVSLCMHGDNHTFSLSHAYLSENVTAHVCMYKLDKCLYAWCENQCVSIYSGTLGQCLGRWKSWNACSAGLANNLIVFETCYEPVFTSTERPFDVIHVFLRVLPLCSTPGVQTVVECDQRMMKKATQAMNGSCYRMLLKRSCVNNISVSKQMSTCKLPSDQSYRTLLSNHVLRPLQIADNGVKLYLLIYLSLMAYLASVSRALTLHQA